MPDVREVNGRDVVITDEQGRYELPDTDDFTASVTQPAGWQVPVDELRRSASRGVPADLAARDDYAGCVHVRRRRARF